MTDDLVRIVGEMLDVLMPVLSEISTAEELAATSLRVVRRPAGHPVPPLEAWPARQGGDPLDEDTLLELRTFDHRRGSWMQGIETAADMRTRFRSELQDHVAESAFGWGQWRP